MLKPLHTPSLVDVREIFCDNLSPGIVIINKKDLSQLSLHVSKTCPGAIYKTFIWSYTYSEWVDSYGNQCSYEESVEMSLRATTRGYDFNKSKNTPRKRKAVSVIVFVNADNKQAQKHPFIETVLSRCILDGTCAIIPVSCRKDVRSGFVKYARFSSGV